MNPLRLYVSRHLSVPFVAVQSLALLIGAAAAARLPFGPQYATYYYRGEHFARTGRVFPDTYYPVAYTAVIAAGYFAHGRAGVFVIQALLYAATVGFTYWLLRLCGLSAVWAAVGAAAAGSSPYLIVSITRSVDSNIIAPLLVALVAQAVLIARRGASWPMLCAFGVTAGMALAQRPNLALLVLALLVLIRKQLRLPSVALMLGCGAIPVVLVTVLIIGRPTYPPTNGPYTWYTGANAYTAQALLRDYNAELSLRHYLGDFHVKKLRTLQEPRYQGELTRHAITYVTHHPLQYVGLAFLKLYTLFRPDFRPRPHRFTKFDGLVEIAAALPMLIWLVAAGLWGRGTRLEVLTVPVFALLLALYVAPFLLTDSDPRYRYPLDPLLLGYAVALFVARPRGRLSSAEGA